MSEPTNAAPTGHGSPGAEPAPRLVVVLPTYNKASQIRATLDCLAGQTFRDFRAIILENRSTDASLSVAEEFCRTDPRFTIVQNDIHLSALDNFAKAIRIGATTAPYFCLRAADDLSSADFLERLVAALDADPTRLLAVCGTRSILGDRVKRKVPNPRVLEFGRRYAEGYVPRNLTYPAEWIYGVFRAEAAADMLARWNEYGSAWAQASYIVTEFVVRDRFVYVEGPTYDFIEGSGSAQIFAARGFREKLRLRLKYTLGCYALHRKLPPAGLWTRFLFFRMCWNDSRRKTHFKLLGFL
jgi:glycosyltransferase involved in cell wall biosynthesis